ncbi:MAG TPA: hypothetical protein VKR06_19500 [Ktedonosporobacter sp.]|nr:hypothetical protein [Ktedonosporobacter sp.]
MVVRITSMVLRVCALLAVILGIIFWTGTEPDALVNVHMLLGILVVLSLWTLGILQALGKGGNWGLAAGAIILGLIVAGFGMTQRSIPPLDPTGHQIIKVIHLLLGLSAAGLGEMLAGRYKRLNA